jgi:hypothetical protein
MDSGDNDVGGCEEDAEMIAAYFDLHGLSTGLIVDRMNNVRTFPTKRLFLRLSIFLFLLFAPRGRARAQPRG